MVRRVGNIGWWKRVGTSAAVEFRIHRLIRRRGNISAGWLVLCHLKVRQEQIAILYVKLISAVRCITIQPLSFPFCIVNVWENQIFIFPRFWFRVDKNYLSVILGNLLYLIVLLNPSQRYFSCYNSRLFILLLLLYIFPHLNALNCTKSTKCTAIERFTTPEKPIIRDGWEAYWCRKKLKRENLVSVYL